MKITSRDDVTRTINRVVFEQGTPLQVCLAAYELWAIETAMKRFPSIELAARSVGMTRRQFSYRLRQGDTGWSGEEVSDGDTDEK